MFGEFYKDCHILSSAVYSEYTRCWTSKVAIYPPVRISLTPTMLTSAEAFFTAESDAKQQAVRMGRDWVDRHICSH